MPSIFYTRDGRWQVEPVPVSPCRLALAPVRLMPTGESGGRGPDEVLLAGTKNAGQWVLIAGNNVMHNGQPISAGMCVLAHRDSLASEGQAPVFFSTEEPPHVEEFAAQASVTCPRCRAAILPGEPSVRCPGCGVFHHETKERNCWTYAAKCALCLQPTALDAGLQWTPEAL